MYACTVDYTIFTRYQKHGPVYLVRLKYAKQQHTLPISRDSIHNTIIYHFRSFSLCITYLKLSLVYSNSWNYTNRNVGDETSEEPKFRSLLWANLTQSEGCKFSNYMFNWLILVYKSFKFSIRTWHFYFLGIMFLSSTCLTLQKARDL